MVEGLPFETRPPEKADDRPLFPQQTRAPYHKAADYSVATITNQLHLPWCIAFLPDGKFLITEKENPSALRIADRDGTISAPITGLAMLAAPGQLGLLDVALDPHFTNNKRVFFTFSNVCRTATAIPMSPVPCWMKRPALCTESP